MTAIKEALELKPCPFCGGEALMLKDHKSLGYYITCKSCFVAGATKTKSVATEQWNTRATFQPDGERREAIARIIDPDTYHAYDIHKKSGTVAENGKPWCDVVCGKDIAAALAKADTILASGLVQNEAGWRDISTAPKDGITILVVGQPSQIEGVRIGSGIFTAYWDDIDSSFCLSAATWQGPFVEPTHWKPLPAPPTRSARDGGEG